MSSPTDFADQAPFFSGGPNEGISMMELPDPPDAFGRYPSWRAYRKESDLTKPSPANLIVFLDEHPDSIIGGCFYTDVDDTGVWWGLPASYHNGAGTVCFADGHSEFHNWQQSATRQPVTFKNIAAQIHDSPDNVDIAWVTNHVSCTRN
jgi:prepilin-type processing-associated H-X9-DG protein